jgi:hypothetical protein
MKIYLGPVEISLTHESDVNLPLFPSKQFTTPLIPSSIKLNGIYALSNNLNHLSGFKHVLTGESTDPDQMPYNWHVLQKENRIAIKIDYITDNQFKHIIALLDPDASTIHVYLIPLHGISRIQTDPMVQPLGSLLMVYLAHLSGGFLIHASGLKDANKGYIFSAVSGTGKSTMAGLWEQAGSIVINDDRLWMHKIDTQWHMLSTPMIWYAQKPLITPVHSAFLIRQSPVNELKKITGINATMRVMSNCIQHFSNKEMTAQHLDRVIDFTSKTAVYDCGFKPDREIVDLIRSID